MQNANIKEERGEKSIYSRPPAMKAWERKNQPLENPKHDLTQQETTSSQNEAVAASVGMVFLQMWAAGVPAQGQPQPSVTPARHSTALPLNFSTWLSTLSHLWVSYSHPKLSGELSCPTGGGSLESFPVQWQGLHLSPSTGCSLSRWDSSSASRSSKCDMEQKGKKRSLVALGRGMESSSGSLEKHRRAKPDKGSTEAARKRLGRNTSRRIFKKALSFLNPRDLDDKEESGT